jgi:hypothetical protein
MATIESTEPRTGDVVTLTEGAATKVARLMAEEPAGEAEVLRVAKRKDIAIIDAGIASAKNP